MSVATARRLKVTRQARHVAVGLGNSTRPRLIYKAASPTDNSTPVPRAYKGAQLPDSVCFAASGARGMLLT